MPHRGLGWVSFICSLGFACATFAGEPLPPDAPPVAEPSCCDDYAGPCLWASTEYLLWWVKGSPLPVPLVTTGPTSIVGAENRAGVIGNPSTVLLIGNQDLNFGPLSGGRFTLGGWLEPTARLGLEGGYLFLSQRNTTLGASAPGTPGSAPLSIPFFDPTIGAENSTGIANPVGATPFAGTGLVTATTRLQGAELNGLAVLSRRGGVQLHLLGGFRYLNLDEGLTFGTSSPAIPPNPPDVFVTQDQFFTRSDFYGGQLGLRGLFQEGRWFGVATGKVALGDMHERVRIDGTLATNDFSGFGPIQTFRGAYLALPTNIGRYTQDSFAVVPEVNLSLGYQVSPYVAVFAGYSFLYLSNVVRPGDQIDRVINPTQGPGFSGDASSVLTGPARPTYLGNTGDFWAHGINLGLAVIY